MNQSNREIKDFATELTQSADSSVSSQLAPLLEEWEKVIACRNNFLGFQKAAAVVQALASHNIDFPAALQRDRADVIQRFTEIPPDVRGVLRINICLPYSEIMSCLQSVMQLIENENVLFDLINRVEVAKPPFKPDIKVVYPTLIFYLESSANQQAYRPLLKSFLIGMQAILAQQRWEHATDATFADSWMPFVTVTQGFKLFKKYLDLIGALDQVYSSDRNYAYLNDSSKENHNFPMVLDTVRNNVRNATTKS